jgi:hypothetical protein
MLLVIDFVFFVSGKWDSVLMQEHGGVILFKNRRNVLIIISVVHCMKFRVYFLHYRQARLKTYKFVTIIF